MPETYCRGVQLLGAEHNLPLRKLPRAHALAQFFDRPSQRQSENKGESQLGLGNQFFSASAPPMAKSAAVRANSKTSAACVALSASHS